MQAVQLVGCGVIGAALALLLVSVCFWLAVQVGGVIGPAIRPKAGRARRHRAGAARWRAALAAAGLALQGWQCAGGAVGRGGLLYAGIGQAGSAGMVCSRPGGGVLPGAGSLRRALAAAGGAV